MNKTFSYIVIGVAFIAALAWWQRDALMPLAFTQRSTGMLPVASPIEKKDQEIMADNLQIPWELVFLPDGSMLITERAGRLVKITESKQLIPIAGVEHVGEGGLLGLALHPDFASNNLVYLYLTSRVNGALVNGVRRYTLDGNTLMNEELIITGIPGGTLHDGGRIAFGPDKKLYITTGDAGVEKNAQDVNSLSGKILRVNEDGSIPSDNPFKNAVYSYGHRNPQGITWDTAGGLWATEHGRSGAKSGFDEVNRIEMGRNYGWPDIQGNETKDGMEPPLAHSGASVTWAPSGAVVLGNELYFTGLRGEALYKADISGDRVTNITVLLNGQFGRLRSVVLGPDGSLYILTNNTDGRGKPREEDDKIIRINPEAL